MKIATQLKAVPEKELSLDDKIRVLKDRHRHRQEFHGAEKRLTMQIKSIGRRMNGGKKIIDEKEMTVEMHSATLQLQEARIGIKARRMEEEKELKKIAKLLPVYEWWKRNKGLAELGLGQIIGECGDLSNYDNPAKVWKRMGLAVIDDKAQGKRTGAEAIKHGYSPRRRAVMFCIGESMIKTGDKYRQVYLDRKEYEETRTQTGYDAKKVIVDKLKDKVKSKENKERVANGILPMYIVHKRAQRYMEKMILRDLWNAWREV